MTETCSVVKRFLGGAVKKTTDAARTLAAEATLRKRSVASLAHYSGGRKAEALPPSTTGASSSKEMEKLGRLATDIKVSRLGVAMLCQFFHLINLHPCHQTTDAELGFKRIQAHKSGPFDFENIQFAQELESPHLGPIWCMKFSHCGQLLATAGQDKNIMIWVVKDSYDHFKGDENNSREVRS